MDRANAAFMFLNNDIFDGNALLCGSNPHGGANDDLFVGPVIGTASCGSPGYAGLAASAVTLGAIGGLGQPAMAQITGSNIVAGQPKFQVQMGGQWQDTWLSKASVAVTVHATYTLTASLQKSGIDPGSGYDLTALAYFNQSATGCHVGDGVSTLNGTCTATVTFAAGESILEVASVLSDVYVQAISASDSFEITLDPINFMTLSALSFTDANGNPLPFSDIQSASGIALTATGYASSVPEPSSIYLTSVALGLLIALRYLKTRMQSLKARTQSSRLNALFVEATGAAPADKR